MTPLNGNFSVSLARPIGPAATSRPTPEFVVEVAKDDFCGPIIQGLPVEKDIIQARPVVIEAQPDVVQALPCTQSPWLVTPPTEDPPQEDGWFLSH